MAANNTFRSSITPADVQAVSPALANYTKTAVVDGVWNRPGLSRRDRSIVTVATLISRIQTIGMEHYFAIALDSGVTPAELSEIVTHLAFYCGWSNAFQAVEVLQGILAARGIGADQLPEISPELLPLTRKPRQRELRRYRKTSEKRHRAYSRTPRSSSFATCGCGPHLHRAIAVSLPWLRWLRLVRSHRFRIT